MTKKRCKRAQITLFLIIGIFMLFAIGFLFFVSSQIDFQAKKVGIEQSVSQLIAQCLKQRVIESYALTGIDAERTRNYVDHELLSCADLSVFEDQAEISRGDVSSSVTVSDEVISTQIELPIIIKQKESVIRLDTFNYHLPRYFTTKLPVDSNGVVTKDVIARSADGRLELYIKAGTVALTNDEEPLKEVTIHTRSITQRDPVLYYYTVYDLQPHGAYFQQNKPKLSFKYIPSFNIENSLQIVKREIGSNFWKKMDSTPNTQRQMIETRIDGFSEVGLDPECDSKIYVKGEVSLTKDVEDGSCSGEYTINLEGGEDAVLCGIYLVDSTVKNKITEQGFRLNQDDKGFALYDQELTQNSLHNPDILETINIAINNKVRPDQNKFFAHIDSENRDCSEKSAKLVFMVKGTNLNCENVGVSGECCSDIEACKVSDNPITPEELPELDEPEPCGNKKGIVIHLRDTRLNPEYWEPFLSDAEELVGPGGWVLEDVDTTIDASLVSEFTQEVKARGMRPIIRLSPRKGGKFLPEAFAEYAYEVGKGLNPPGYFVQVCNEPNHPGWDCSMSAGEYAKEMIKFIDKLHELDEDERIKVVSAGLDPTSSPGYAEELFNYRVTKEDGTEVVFHDAIDIWATHAYDTPQWNIEMDLASKENIPVLVTEAGYPRTDDPGGFYKRLCPNEDVTKLLYNCLDPFKNLNEVKEEAGKIDVREECERNEWERCEAVCENDFSKCTAYDEQGDPYKTCWECGYTDEEAEFCCESCTYRCPAITNWDTVEEWLKAHQDFKDYIVNSYGDWAGNDIIIGVTPFLLFDGKEITGVPSVKTDYGCGLVDFNFRPRYWEYVQYEDNERACENPSTGMPDPYQYYVFDEISTKTYANYDCQFTPSGPDEDDTGEALPVEEEEAFIEGHCLTLYLEASCSSWTVKIVNICGYAFGDVGVDLPPYDEGTLSCYKPDKPCGKNVGEEFIPFDGHTLPVMRSGDVATISGSYHGSGTQHLEACSKCAMCFKEGDPLWPEHEDGFCVSTTLQCG